LGLKRLRTTRNALGSGRTVKPKEQKSSPSSAQAKIAGVARLARRLRVRIFEKVGATSLPDFFLAVARSERSSACDRPEFSSSGSPDGLGTRASTVGVRWCVCST
jgi:hypothetical protein